MTAFLICSSTKFKTKIRFTYTILFSEDRCFLGNNRYQFKMAEPTVFYKNIISDDVDFISYVKSSLIGKLTDNNSSKW